MDLLPFLFLKSFTPSASLNSFLVEDPKEARAVNKRKGLKHLSSKKRTPFSNHFVGTFICNSSILRDPPSHMRYDNVVCAFGEKCVKGKGDRERHTLRKRERGLTTSGTGPPETPTESETSQSPYPTQMKEAGLLFSWGPDQCSREGKRTPP